MISSALLFSAALAAPITGNDDAAARCAGSEHPTRDIVDTAVAAGSFQTLVAAVQAAGLVDVLKGEGPFTVFAPSDDAFAKLPAGTIDALLEPQSRGRLTSILTYHVAPGRLVASDVLARHALDSVNGQRIEVATRDGGAFVDGAKIVTTDIACANGVIHVIDSVILPSEADIVATAGAAGSFRTLLAAAKAAGLADALAGDGPLTVFAPTDDAFAKLPEGTVESLLRPENKEKLAAILKLHVVSGRVFADQAVAAGDAKTLLGESVHIRKDDHGVRVGGARVVKADVDASNGVIHVIDAVLLPKG